MRKNILGNTKIKVSQLGIGLSEIGSELSINDDRKIVGAKANKLRILLEKKYEVNLSFYTNLYFFSYFFILYR